MQSKISSQLSSITTPSSENYRLISQSHHDDGVRNGDHNKQESNSDDGDDAEIIPVPLSERRKRNLILLDTDHDEQDDEDEKKEARPISIMLRNCFPPSQVLTDASSTLSGPGDGKEQPNGKDSDAMIYNTRSSDDSPSNSKLDQNTDDAEGADENDTTLDNYQIFAKTNQWRNQANKNIFLPIEMEIVVEYRFLIQLHSHQKDENVRSRIRHLFGLSGNNIGSHNENSCNNGDRPNRCNDKSTDDEEVIVLCSKLQDTRSSHPLWDHVNEKLDDLHDLIPRGNDLWNDLYKAMRIQFRAIIPSQSEEEIGKEPSIRFYEDDVSSSGSSSFDDEGEPQDTMSCKQSTSILLATSPLHPYKLKPITPTIQDAENTNYANSSLILGSSKFKEAIPHYLPPNSILIHFSDGTTRVCPQLFDVLVKKDILTMNSIVSNEVDVDKFAKRFEDDVFDVLEDRGYVKAKLNFEDNVRLKGEEGNNNNESSSTSNICIKKNKNQESSSTATTTTEKNEVNGYSNDFKSISTNNDRNNQASSRSLSRGAFADAFDSMTGSASSLPKALKYETSDVEDSKGSKEEEIPSNACDEETCITQEQNETDNFPEAQKHCMHDVLDLKMEEEFKDMEKQIDELNIILSREEKLLKRDEESQKLISNDLIDFNKCLFDIDMEILEIDEETEKTLQLCQHAQFMLDARRKKMLRELFRIYPIQILPDSVYTIRGIHLPHDMHSLTGSDEIISAGLGFVCHVVSLCSKYLSIPLRYRVICNSSRSAVRDDDFDVFPLFKERVVEKEQFDRAVVLLHRNIELLLRMSGTTTPTSPLLKSQPNHILAKLYLLFHSHIDIGNNNVHSSNGWKPV